MKKGTNLIIVFLVFALCFLLYECMRVKSEAKRQLDINDSLSSHILEIERLVYELKPESNDSAIIENNKDLIEIIKNSISEVEPYCATDQK